MSRILIVEDAEKIARSLQKGLTVEGYQVELAFDGAAGYQLARQHAFDVILLDLMLPEMDGYQVCRQLRADGIHTPVLMLTARGELDDKVQGLDIGADDYLTKPFDYDELLARVRALIRRPPKAVPPVVTLDTLEIDTTRQQVTRAGQRLKLSSKEYALLEYLAWHLHQPVNKDQIIAHVWDYDADVLPNTVEVYIGYLRQKVDKAFPDQPPLIQTIRGFGYQLSLPEQTASQANQPESQP